MVKHHCYTSVFPNKCTIRISILFTPIRFTSGKSRNAIFLHKNTRTYFVKIYTTCQSKVSCTATLASPLQRTTHCNLLLSLRFIFHIWLEAVVEILSNLFEGTHVQTLSCSNNRFLPSTRVSILIEYALYMLHVIITFLLFKLNDQ